MASSSYQAVLSGGVAFAPVELPGPWGRRDPTGLSEGLQAFFITCVGTLKAFLYFHERWPKYRLGFGLLCFVCGSMQ